MTYVFFLENSTLKFFNAIRQEFCKLVLFTLHTYIKMEGIKLPRIHFQSPHAIVELKRNERNQKPIQEYKTHLKSLRPNLISPQVMHFYSAENRNVVKHCLPRTRPRTVLKTHPYPYLCLQLNLMPFAPRKVCSKQ